MTAQATESQRRWMKRILRLLIPLGAVDVAVMALAASGVIAEVWLFVALGVYLTGLLGLSIIVWFIMRRARRRLPN